MKTITIILILAFFIGFSLSAGETEGFNPDLNYSQVRFVKAVKNSTGSWTFYVTVRHNDEGWTHYADFWDVKDPESETVFAERILVHPHDTEQPFTRSQPRIVIPEGVRFVEVRAKCNIHGFGGKTIIVDLESDEGEDYNIVLN